MTKAFKLFVRFTFFTLMMAVALRPVVVSASITGSLPETGACGLHLSVGPLGSFSGTTAFAHPRLNASPNLKVIPKETVEVETLNPRFSVSSLSVTGSFHASKAVPLADLFQNRPFVLRI